MRKSAMHCKFWPMNISGTIGEASNWFNATSSDTRSFSRFVWPILRRQMITTEKAEAVGPFLRYCHALVSVQLRSKCNAFPSPGRSVSAQFTIVVFATGCRKLHAPPLHRWCLLGTTDRDERSPETSAVWPQAAKSYCGFTYSLGKVQQDSKGHRLSGDFELKPL